MRIGKKILIIALTAVCTSLCAQDSAEQQVLALSLDDAKTFAVDNNKALQNASIEVKKAHAQRWQTIASMLPQVDGTAQFMSMFDYSIDMGAMQLAMPANITHSVTASIGLNGQSIMGALLNNLAIEMQDISYLKSESDLRANVTTSYMSILVMEDVIDLLESSLENIDRLAKMTQHMVDVGAAEQTAADQIIVRANALRNSINSNKRDTELARSSLKVLLGVDVNTQLELTQTLDELLSAGAALDLLGTDFDINNNYDYQLLQKNTELAKKDVTMAGLAYTPTVSAYYQFTSKKYFSDEATLNMSAPHTVGVSVSIPLWSSGKRAAAVHEKKLAYQAAQNTLNETTDNLGIQNQQLRFNLTNAYETYINEKENIEVAQRIFQNTTNKFEQGIASNLELTNASNDLITAQSSYVQAVLTLVNSQVRLAKFLNK